MILRWISILALASSLQTPAKEMPQGFLEKVEGVWNGSGVVTRRESRITFTVEKGPGATMLLRFHNQMSGPGPAVFEGIAVYERENETEYKATWWDSLPSKHPIVATVGKGGTEMTSLWGSAGKTVYSLTDAGDVEIVDSFKRPDGSWAEFGRSKVSRRK